MSEMSKKYSAGDALADLIWNMIELRKENLAQRGLTATEDQIANHVKASLIRMIRMSVTEEAR